MTVLNPPKPFSIYSMSANFAERLPKVHVTNSREKRKIDSLSGLYSTIKVTESLEVAYARSAISADEYEKECKKILSHFKIEQQALLDDGLITSVDNFMREYDVQCPRARNRLLQVGVPATIIDQSHDNRDNREVVVLEATQHHITAIDALKLEQRAVDEIQPLISDVVSSLTKCSLPPEFQVHYKLSCILTVTTSIDIFLLSLFILCLCEISFAPSFFRNVDLHFRGLSA